MRPLSITTKRTTTAFHTALPPLVEQSDTKPHVDLHLLFLELTSHTVLNNDIRRVLPNNLSSELQHKQRGELTAPRR